jgi:5'-AMP-activated protein kinase regulatory beta subunit
MPRKTDNGEKTDKKTLKKQTTDKKTAKKTANKKARLVVFKIYAPEAKEIHLVADFNNWETHALPMHKREDGVWEVPVELLPGEYQYKYLVDGRWENDIQEEMYPNPFGTMNNVMKIE